MNVRRSSYVNQGGNVSYRLIPHDLNKPWISNEVVDFGNPEGVLVTVPAVSIVVTDGALPHASETNRTDSPRRAYLFQYSRQPVLKDGKPVQMAIPFLQGGVRRVPTLDEIRRMA